LLLVFRVGKVVGFRRELSRLPAVRIPENIVSKDAENIPQTFDDEVPNRYLSQFLRSMRAMRREVPRQSRDRDLVDEAISLVEMAAKPAPVNTDDAVERLLEVARVHGEDSEPDHEVGDLQDFMRAMWGVLTPQQRLAYLRTPQVCDVLAGALVSSTLDAADAASLGDEWPAVCAFFGIERNGKYSEQQVADYVNIHRLVTEAPLATERFIHGSWSHLLPGNKELSVRLVYDSKAHKIVAMQEREARTGVWLDAPASLVEDVQDSLVNANAEALSRPADFGLLRAAGQPSWAMWRQPAPAGSFLLHLASCGNPDYGQDPHASMEGCAADHWVCVAGPGEASRSVRSFIEEHGLGSGNWAGGALRKADGQLVGQVYYNGRVETLSAAISSPHDQGEPAGDAQLRASRPRPS
jgi:hypothetical protein